MLLGSATASIRRAGSVLALVGSAAGLPACASDNDLVLADAALDKGAAAATKSLLATRAHDLTSAAQTLCAAAPPPAADGWVRARDGAQIEAMKAAWHDAHLAYEGIAGAAEMLFADLDTALDTRYEGALSVGPDIDPFDDAGFVGLHAVERILWADRIPKTVVAAESSLAGYTPAAFPADAAGATRFRDMLCARLIADAAALESQIGVLDLDSSPAYETARRLDVRQVSSLIAAGEGREESRYSACSLSDMAASLSSAQATYMVFRPWLLKKSTGVVIDAQIATGFATLQTEYAAFGSDSLPFIPEGWSIADITPQTLETPFGQLFSVVSREMDESASGSLGSSMNAAAHVLGIEGGHVPAPSLQIPKGDGDDG